MRRTIGVSAAVALAAGLVMTVPAAASAAPDGHHKPNAVAQAADASTLRTYHRSQKCGYPNKDQKVSYSYMPGKSSTKFTYKNRCLGTKRIRIWYQSNGTRCKNITLRGGVSGTKKVNGITKNNLKNADFGKCPRIPAAATSG
ncbi:hypothetical protein OHR68_31150 [Spirillospora sp. NBC_00431]